MQQQIIERKIHKVKNWNSTKRAEGKYIMIFTLGNGSMIDEPRKKGYVVEKRHREGGHSCKYFSNYTKALSNFYQDKF